MRFLTYAESADWCSRRGYPTRQREGYIVGPEPDIQALEFQRVEFALPTDSGRKVVHFGSLSRSETRFRERGRMAPDGLRYVSSWVDLNFERCFQIMEAEDAELLAEWTANWDDLVDFEIVPVRTSQEATAVIERQL